MKDFLSKLSLYDFLTTILLGCYALFLIGVIGDVIKGNSIYEYLCNYSSLLKGGLIVGSSGDCNLRFWLLLFIAYLLGLTIHKTVELFTFYNVGIMIKVVDEFFGYMEKNRCICKLYGVLCLVFIYVRSMFSLLFTKNFGLLIYYARKRVERFIPKSLINLIPVVNNGNLIFRYYKAYYYLEKKGKLGNIPTLEAHSALFKDLFYVSIMLFWTPVCKFWAVLSLMALMIARLCSERKIYELVWEGYIIDII